MVGQPSVHPLRYLAVVGMHPLYAVVAMAAVAALGLATVWLNAAELDSGLGMILFAQMFLASSGFVVRARQGHLDPLLTNRDKRTAVVVFHWALSIAPGIIAWALVAGAEFVLGSSAAVSAFIGTRVAALLVVSSIAWAVGFALPRGAAGMLWMAVLLALLTQRAALLPEAARLSAGPAIVLLDAVTLMVCPFLLVGNHPAVSPGAVNVAVLVSFVLLLLVWRYGRRLDIYLVDRA